MAYVCAPHQPAFPAGAPFGVLFTDTRAVWSGGRGWTHRSDVLRASEGSYVVKGCLRSPPPSRWSVLRAWQMRSDRRSLRARMASRLVLPVSRAGTEQTLTYTYSPRPTTAAWSAASTRPTSRASMSALPSCRVLSRPATGRAGPCGLCLGSFPGRPVPRLATAAY